MEYNMEDVTCATQAPSTLPACSHRSGHPLGRNHGGQNRARPGVTKALCLDAFVRGGHPLLVAAVALRAIYRHRLPSGHPNPYSVFGLIPDVPAARIEAYYRQASDLLNRECLNRAHVHHPCYPAFSAAARLVADAWAFLSDADRKASLDARFTTNAPLAAAAPTTRTTPSGGGVVPHGRRAPFV
nr:unnamed protein product [Digitaria exilis]